MDTNKITITTVVHATATKAWDYWTSPTHIVKWNNASEDWHTTRAENDLQVGGKFLSRMEAKDGSFGFDFDGIYDEVVLNKHIAYTIGDGRKVIIDFEETDGQTKITETFEAENINSIEQQKVGWQSILDNFKKYTEDNEK
ncbi:SRPBCC family protein [Arachidicoccus soli]|uniref:Polyketide cyclase n=1 Tax=Arachidicoccus soli TaxID=2341117 RepID=A0A386HLK9_9BACT|nr:SRPBCC family protein [Arachidicoccus soli]AYD46506.1 polyketide cyclase [Arachidicoccus soli]